MKSVVVAVSLSLALVGCTPSDPPAQSAAPAAAPAAPAVAVTPKAKGQSFGRAIEEATPFVALADILKDPKAWSGKKVRTRGEVVAVCQNAGCWCDLRPEGAAANQALVPTHVTMHGHAFFLPKTAKSRVAEVEGNLVVRELSQGEVEHFNSEGASLTAGTPVVNVDALGVTLL